MASTTLEEKRVQQDIEDTKEISKSLEIKRKQKQERAERAERNRKEKQENPSRLRRAMSWLKPETTQGGVPVMVWTVFFRSTVLIAFYLMAVATAQGVIPALGMWLHQQSGAAQGQLTSDGTLAMWVMPLLFMVTLVTVAELVLMRAMWRWSSRMIAKTRGTTGVPDEPTEPLGSARKTTHQSKKNSKRSK